MKIRVGITGQEGFVGTHLYNSLGLFPEEFERVEYDIAYFKDSAKLKKFVSECDVIVHLAAMNRHNDPQMIYDTNIGLVKQLIEALKSVESKAHVLFSSSSQEERDNLYGKSKKEGRELFVHWEKSSGGTFTGLVIPNVFGPFGNPYYNSFIATFSHQLTHNEIPKIETDGEVKLIYVGDLVQAIISEIRAKESKEQVTIPYTDEFKVSHILELLKTYKNEYFDAGNIPALETQFHLNLFNTFRSYIDIQKHYPVQFKLNTDPRGSFVEIIRLNTGGQISFSTTVPNITRGNHFHTRKIERFAVIKGKASIQMRKVGTNEVIDFLLDGDNPGFVDMPIWYTHNISNIGTDELYTVFWINESYDPSDPDTYFQNV